MPYFQTPVLSAKASELQRRTGLEQDCCAWSDASHKVDLAMQKEGGRDHECCNKRYSMTHFRTKKEIEDGVQIHKSQIRIINLKTGRFSRP